MWVDWESEIGASVYYNYTKWDLKKKGPGHSMFIATSCLMLLQKTADAQTLSRIKVTDSEQVSESEQTVKNEIKWIFSVCITSLLYAVIELNKESISRLFQEPWRTFHSIMSADCKWRGHFAVKLKKLVGRL